MTPLCKVLDCRQNLGRVKLSLICVGRYPGLDHFVGLGQLTAHQLASLADKLPMRSWAWLRPPGMRSPRLIP